MKPDFRKRFRRFLLHVVMIHCGDRGVGGGEAVRMNQAVAIAGIVRRDLRPCGNRRRLGI